MRSKYESWDQSRQVNFLMENKLTLIYPYSMSKVLKTMGKDDSLTIRVNDDSDAIIIAMESQSRS